MRAYWQTTIGCAIVMGLISCQFSPVPARSESLQLGLARQNGVEVIVSLTRGEYDQFALSANFTPLEAGLHLYSKDIPKNGVDGLGRPTLLELAADSKLTALGELMESVPAQTPDFDPKELLVYPAGEVTLSLPIDLPSGACWLEEKVSVTYMACGEKGCKPPVIGKTIDVRLPCKDTATNP